MDPLWLPRLLSQHRSRSNQDLVLILRAEPELRSRWRRALPASVVAVPNLTTNTITKTIAERFPISPELAFLTKPPAEFAAALVPIGEPSDRFALFLDADLDAPAQRELLEHAIAHLFLGHLCLGDTTSHWDYLDDVRLGNRAIRRWDREANALLEGVVQGDPIPEFRVEGLGDAWSRLSSGQLDEVIDSAQALADTRRSDWIDVGQDLIRQADLFPHQARGAAEIAVRLKRLNVALLADSVGLGKTRTTATVIRLLHDRGELKRAAILTPRKLERNWRNELKLLNLTMDGRGAVVKLINKDMFKRLTPSQAAQEVSGCELIVVEEAHQDMRNHGNRFHRNLRAVMGLERRGLLVTATPWNNRRGDIFAMLQPFMRPLPSEPQELFGPFKRGFRAGRKEFEESDDLFYRVYDRAVLQRTRRQLRAAGDARVYYAPRQPFLHLVPYNPRQRAAFQKLLTQIEALKLPYFNPIRYLVSEDDSENRLSNTHRFFFLKRAESSFVAFDQTLQGTAARALHMQGELEKVADTDAAMATWLRVKYKLTDEADADTQREGELLNERVTTTRQRRIENLIRRALANRGALQSLRAQLLRDARNDAQRVAELHEEFKTLFEQDPKLNAVVELVRVKRARGEKVLAISQFADTAYALYRALRDDPVLATGGIGLIMSTAKHNESAIQLDGKTATREDVIRRFAPQAWREVEVDTGRALRETLMPESDINILVGTDTLSVGQNLQDARCLIHLDLTWNPMVLEQRIGRLDRPRHAEDNAPIEIYYFLNLDLIEAELKLKERLEARLEATYRDTAFDDEILPGYFELIEHYRRLRMERANDNNYAPEADVLLEELASARPRSPGAGTLEADRAALEKLLHAFPHAHTNSAQNLILTLGKSTGGAVELAAEYELQRFDVNSEPIGAPEHSVVYAMRNENEPTTIQIGALAPVVEAMLTDVHALRERAQMETLTRLFRETEQALLEQFESYREQRNQAQIQQRAAAAKARPIWLNQLLLEIQNALLNLSDEAYTALQRQHKLTDAQITAWRDALRAGIDTDDEQTVETLRGYVGLPQDALKNLRVLYDLLLANEGLDESESPMELGALDVAQAQQLEMDLNRITTRVQGKLLNLRVNLP